MKYTMIGLILFLMITSTWAGTLIDDFNDGDMEEWIKEGEGIWRIKNGELVLKPVNSPFGFAIGETTWENYTVSVKVKIVEHQATPGWTEGAGLSLRYSPQWNAYYFTLATLGISPKRAQAVYTQGNFMGLHFEFKPFEWELDTWYNLRVTAEGEQFKFYVDDELVLEYEDNVHPTGQVGVGLAYTKTTAHFDDFVVSGDDVPNLNYSVSPKDKVAGTWGKIKKL
jgi:hypothetical protein